MADNSIVNLGDISKPATVLIEKISDAVGIIYEPLRVVRMAQAEAKADLIRAQSEIEITDLHRRALTRFVKEEAIKQDNMESIIQQAVPQIKEEASPEDVENDWIAHFFNKCRLTSDADIQLMWSRILAGEANAPGSYSKRTVDILSSMDKVDAMRFANLCGFCWTISNTPVPLVYDDEANVCNNNGVVFGTLNHLDKIGLITFSTVDGFKLSQQPKSITVSYNDAHSTIEFERDTGNDLQLGMVILTNAGVELASICDSKIIPEFREYIHEEWRKQGCNVSTQ